MRFLTYENLDPGGFADKIAKVGAAIERDDFRSPDVKKLNVDKLYRAKLDDAARLILTFVTHAGQKACLALEVLPTHAYDKSRFLRGARIDESKLAATSDVADQDCPPIRYLHPTRSTFHVLDKPLSFDDDQEAALGQKVPMIVVGPAGSGKTAMLLEGIRRIPGRVAYVTESPKLAATSRAQYIAFTGAPDDQVADFLSYAEFLAAIQLPDGRPVEFRDFDRFVSNHRKLLAFTDTQALFEEFRGVITADPAGVLSRETYLGLGVKQSMYDTNERTSVFDAFEKYLSWIAAEGLYEPNLAARDLLELVKPTYEFLVVDEIQDLTAVQLALLLRTLKVPGAYVLAGDANQIVHPNYFSWAGIKSQFWRELGEVHDDQIRLLSASYRNSSAVVAAGNRLLRLKQLQFGSLDRESNQLMRAVGGVQGEVRSFTLNSSATAELDKKTSGSSRTAVVVLREADKAAAKNLFKTPLLFSVQEVKGLEYDTIILFRLVAAERKRFAELADGIDLGDLDVDELPYRRAKDKTDKSGEKYKFFVNSLYVAMTRAVVSLYLVEDDVSHPLLGLLGISTAADTNSIAHQRTTTAQWQEEARQLERRGNTEQAAAIRRTILKYSKVPWPVFDRARLPQLVERALAPRYPSLKALDRLVEFASFHDEQITLARIERLSGRPVWAKYGEQVEQGMKAALERCFGKETADILRDTELYGVDYRTQVGLTPLMLAAFVADLDLVEELCRRGANVELTDHLGRQAVHWALRGNREGINANSDTMGRMYDLLAPVAFEIQVGGKVQQIGREQGEYLVWQLITARRSELWQPSWGNPKSVTKNPITAEFLDDDHFRNLPDAVCPEKHRNRVYLSEVLARSAVGSNSELCRELWVSATTGGYDENPALQLKVAGDDAVAVWMPAYKALGTDWLDAQMPASQSRRDPTPVLQSAALIRK